MAGLCDSWSGEDIGVGAETCRSSHGKPRRRAIPAGLLDEVDGTGVVAGVTPPRSG